CRRRRNSNLTMFYKSVPTSDSYVRNDQVNFVDPSGLLTICYWNLVGWDKEGILPDQYEVTCYSFGNMGRMTGGGGGGGGGGQDLPPDDNAKDNFDKFNRDNPGCKEAIDAIAGKEGAFEAAFNNTRWLYAGGLSNDEKAMKKMKLSQ